MSEKVLAMETVQTGEFYIYFKEPKNHGVDYLWEIVSKKKKKKSNRALSSRLVNWLR